MKKSNKVVLAQPAATAPRLLPRAPGPVRGPAGAGGESHRARLRYQSLLQDYKELLEVRPRLGVGSACSRASRSVLGWRLCLISSSLGVFLCLI
jgi:hypothetical protein